MNKAFYALVIVLLGAVTIGLAIRVINDAIEQGL